MKNIFSYFLSLQLWCFYSILCTVWDDSFFFAALKLTALTSWCWWSFFWTLRAPGVQLYGGVRFHFWFKVKQSTWLGTKVSVWDHKRHLYPPRLTQADAWCLAPSVGCTSSPWILWALTLRTKELQHITVQKPQRRIKTHQTKKKNNNSASNLLLPQVLPSDASLQELSMFERGHKR